MQEPDVYFGNRVAMSGKAKNALSEAGCVRFDLETKECWPDGETLHEWHEVRYYNKPGKPLLKAEDLDGRLVRITGRIRLKDADSTEYRPFIHCHVLEDASH